MFAEWIFTNKCKAYVDSEGFALQGQALAEAAGKKDAPRCNHRVVIGSKCCPSCGAPAPGGWWTCAKCGQKIGNDSPVCNHCGSEQSLTFRSQLKAGVWHPVPGTIAQRFELNAYKECLSQGLDIQEGQVGLLLCGGEFRKILTAGNHTLSSMEAASGVVGTARPSLSVVLLREGELSFPMQLSDLRTKEGLDVDVTLTVVLTIDIARIRDFLRNILSNDHFVSGRPLSAVFSMESLARNLLSGEVEISLRQFCFTHSAHELFLNPALTLEIERTLSQKLSRHLQSFGFLFIRLGKVSFTGKAFDELRKLGGEIEGKRREQEFRLRADALTKEHEEHLEKQSFDHEKYLKKLAQEMQISDAVREQELVRLRASQELEKKLLEVEERHQLSRKELDSAGDLGKLEARYDEERRLIQKNGEIALQKADHDELIRQRQAELNSSFEDSRMQSEIQRMVNETEHQRILSWLEEQSKARGLRDSSDFAFFEYLKVCDPQTQLNMLIVRGITPAQAEIIVENNEKFLLSKMTPEQIVAWGVAHGKSGADALRALRSEARDAMVEKFISEIRADYQSIMERDERMFTEGIRAIAEAHAAPAQPTTNLTQVLK